MRFYAFLMPLFLVAVVSETTCNKKQPTASTSESKKQILTAKTWQVAETFQNISGTRTHFVRGGENTTGVDIGAMRLKFNKDGTGYNTDISGRTFDMTWSFTSQDESKLRLIVNGNVEYNWMLTEIHENSILQTSTTPGHGLIIAKWTPAP